MTVLALPQPTDSPRSRFGREVRGDRVATMTKAEEIRARLERGAYTVDTVEVAAAMVDRLLESRSPRER